MKALPNRVIFSTGIGSPSAAIGRALDAVEDGANIEKVADRLAWELGWDGTPAFWIALEQYAKKEVVA